SWRLAKIAGTEGCEPPVVGIYVLFKRVITAGGEVVDKDVQAVYADAGEGGSPLGYQGDTSLAYFAARSFDNDVADRCAHCIVKGNDVQDNRAIYSYRGAPQICLRACTALAQH